MFEEVFMPSLFEFIGTFILILLGCGVCAGCNLKKSKSQGGNWLLITVAWGLAVMCAVFVSGPRSGAHLNPAVSIALAIYGSFKWSLVLPYVVAQMLGAFCGAALVYVMYKDHFDITDDATVKLGIFCTIPAIRNYGRNFFCEVVATWLLVFLIIAVGANSPTLGLGSLEAFPVPMVIMAIGMALGGTTGYSLNPARDLAPRIVHAILPIKGKGGSDWQYSWVPVCGPLAGGILAGLCGLLLF